MATGNTAVPKAPTAAWTAAYNSAVARGNTTGNAAIAANKATSNNTAKAAPAPAKPTVNDGSAGNINRGPIGGAGTVPTSGITPATPQAPAVDAGTQARLDEANRQIADLKAQLDKLNAAKEQQTRNVSSQVQLAFEQYDLGSLAPEILRMAQEGMGADQITLELQNTAAYKQRFAANEVRKVKGMNVLSPAEYIATERAYRQVMSASGLPIGFYDQNSDFQKFLENDVSATEVQQRVQLAAEAVNNAPATRDIFSQFYDEGDLIAFALDPTKAEPLIEQRIRAAEATAFGRSQGVNVTQATAEGLGRLGFNFNQLQSGMQQAGLDAGNVGKLNSIYGGDTTADDLVKSTFGTSAESAVKVKKLASQERGTFSGTSGATGASLSTNAGGRL